MTTELTRLTARLLFAPILMIAVAVLVKGYDSVGDGFSAGVIAALALLLQYLVLGREETERRLPMRLLPALTFVGLLGALAVASIPLLRGDAVLTHVPAPGAEVTTVGTLEIITAVAFDAAIFALVLGAAVGIIHTIARATGEEGS